MKIDVLVAEIGSTTTIINAFDNLSRDPVFLGQGMSETTAEDVGSGLMQARKDLETKLGFKVEAKETFATSSAAGGLKMSVHGLVYDMTVKAAKEAALGAGANLKLITAGKLSPFDLKRIQKLNPNIILLAGGVDYGETETALFNSQAIAALKLNIPIIYAGNIVNQDAVKEIFKDFTQEAYLYLTPNVYPKIDTLNVNPARKIIHTVFEKHITEAPGMEKIRNLINGQIIPTPGAVMKAAILLQKALGDLFCIDIGGATTDVFSVAEDTEKIGKVLFAPEPFSKRTVEGDLGVYVNKDNLVELIGKTEIQKNLKLTNEELERILENYQKIPDAKQIPLTELLAYTALKTALERHVGKIITLYGSSGKIQAAEGKDLSGIKYVIATGGSLTRLPNRKTLIETYFQKKNSKLLLPEGEVKILIDYDYIMASSGILSTKYPEAALKLLLKSMEGL